MSDTDLPRPSATRVTLRFHPPVHPDSPDDPVRDDLSACARRGDTLFLACDETTGVERLHLTEAGWRDHRHFDLAEFFELPAGAGGEVDIEGLEIDGSWLWITGSHSLKRAKPGDASRAKALEAMARIKRDGNRQFMGRLPLVRSEDGDVPVLRDGERVAAHVRFTRNGKLRHWLKDDPLIGRFLSIPSKENGLDVEGIAARDLRVWLGLRGPVLRGHGVILEFELKSKHGQLSPRKLDGAARILRWRDALGCRSSGLHRAPDISTALDLPYSSAEDNPEGLARWEGDRWIIVHDSPHPARLSEDADYHADIWHLTG